MAISSPAERIQRHSSIEFCTIVDGASSENDYLEAAAAFQSLTAAVRKLIILHGPVYKPYGRWSPHRRNRHLTIRAAHAIGQSFAVNRSLRVWKNLVVTATCPCSRRDRAKSCGGLRRFLSGGAFSRAPLVIFVSQALLHENSQIREMRLYYCDWDRESFVFPMGKLKVLSMWGDFDVNRRSSFQSSITRLCTLAQSSQIVTLQLSECFLSDDNVAYLGNLIGGINSSLEQPDLRDNASICETGNEAILKGVVKASTRMKYVMLDGESSTVRRIRQICRANVVFARFNPLANGREEWSIASARLARHRTGAAKDGHGRLVARRHTP